MSVWFVDAMHLGDGTVGGTAKVIADALVKLPKEQQPWWIKHRSKEQLHKDCCKVIIDSYTTLVGAQEWIDKEVAKGRSMEDAYDDISFITEVTKKSPMFPRLGAEEDEEEAAKHLDDPEENPEEVAEEAILSLVGPHLSWEEAQRVKDSLKRDGPFAPHKCMKPSSQKPTMLTELERTRARPDRHQRKVLRKARREVRAEKAKAEAPAAEAPSAEALPAEPRQESRPLAEVEAGAAAPSVAALAADAPTDAAPTAATTGRRTTRKKPAVAEAAEAPQAEVEFIREPLMLLGSPNGWDKALAQAKHRLSFYSGRKPTPGKQESRLRLEVPADGMTFQIVSSQRPESFVLCPGLGPHELRDGERNFVPVRLEAEGAGKLPSFVIEGAGVPGEIDIRVSLSADGGMQVWFNEI